MKNYILASGLFIIFIGFSITAQAQTEKGKFLIGGNFNVNKSESNNYPPRQMITSKVETLNMSGNPDVGYFIKNNIAVGIAGGISQSTSERSTKGTPSTYEVKGDGWGYSVGPFLRIYQPIVNKFYFFLNTQATYGAGSTKDVEKSNAINSVSRSNYNNLSLTLTPGFSYFVTSKFALELAGSNLGVTRTHTENHHSANGEVYLKTDNTNTSFNLNPFNISLQSVFIGGRFYF